MRQSRRAQIECDANSAGKPASRFNGPASDCDVYGRDPQCRVNVEPVKLEPLGNVLRVVVVIIAVLVVIGILLDIAGMPIGGWRLSAMGAVA